MTQPAQSSGHEWPKEKFEAWWASTNNKNWFANKPITVELLKETAMYAYRAASVAQAAPCMCQPDNHQPGCPWVEQSAQPQEVPCLCGKTFGYCPLHGTQSVSSAQPASAAKPPEAGLDAADESALPTLLEARIETLEARERELREKLEGLPMAADSDRDALDALLASHWPAQKEDAK